MHSYSFNGLVDLPRGARSTVDGDVSFRQPVTKEQLQSVIATEKAKRFGCDPTEVVFVDFTYTEIPA